ncbi:adenosylcobinamide amidohydrolase [Asanoa sp. WMMD1127]|uniref:adenosylcobinamide amidohydrolase n=1 Tax=Asanoa sp. WMMD1127 TaxID=3016107 RepID=UPI002417C148|nr:adenosylcobinamide amidohydrolase [Asanoa sp. WMMD1127]MDG4822390.1 adenosylcobinamide amidohydrolase [Asanoa sp. WMMD1127]
MPFKPILTARQEEGESIPLLVWRLPALMRAISSAPLGGGIGDRGWVVNATVPMSYARDDPHEHLAALAGELGLDGAGVGLLTGVDVTQRVAAVDGDAEVWATVGLGKPIMAAADHVIPHQHRPGTINIVAFLPQRLSDAALVNAVATITEAKAQALWELGLHATGTATDAVTVLCPADGPAEPYGGPLSLWGGRLARAAHRAVREGGSRPKIPWSER